MLYKITCSCGHEELVKLTGKMRLRVREKRRLERLPCTSCRYAEKNAEATEAARRRNLPELTGTPKQVGYANIIREKTYEALDEMEPFMEENERAKAKYLEWREKLGQRTISSWWIIKKDLLPQGFGFKSERAQRAAALGHFRKLNEIFG